MEEEQVNIKKIITTIDNDKSYSIDVDETTTFSEFKKILAGAAHLLKNCFRIYYGEKEYTRDFDDDTIQNMFPNIDPVPLRIISNKDIYKFEDDLVSISLNINVPCEIHIGKYKMYYCFTCSKSICSNCFSQDHSNHNVEEKADYLAPAQLLMNNIFANSSLYKADSRLSKYMDCVTFRSNLKLNIFDNLRKLINDLEIKFASCLEYFSTSEDETQKNTNDNIELLKTYCIEYFIKLKNDINTKGIIIDDNIFLTLFYKLKEIERYKNEYFEKNRKKYEKLNTLLEPFIKQVETISEELKMTFNMYLNKDIYENFKNIIHENIVQKIEKETVNDFIFRNIDVPRKSLNQMYLGNITSYKNLGKNTYNSPDKFLSKQKQNINPFQRVNYSEQRQGHASEQLLGYNFLSNTKNNRKNEYTNLTWDKNEAQNLIKNKKLSIIEEKNDISMKEDERGIYQNKNNVTLATTTSNINDINSIGGTNGVAGRNIEKIINTITNINNGVTKRNVEETVNTTITNIGGASGVTGGNIEKTINTTITNIEGNNRVTGGNIEKTIHTITNSGGTSEVTRRKVEESINTTITNIGGTNGVLGRNVEKTKNTITNIGGTSGVEGRNIEKTINTITNIEGTNGVTDRNIEKTVNTTISNIGGTSGVTGRNIEKTVNTTITNIGGTSGITGRNIEKTINTFTNIGGTSGIERRNVEETVNTTYTNIGGTSGVTGRNIEKTVNTNIINRNTVPYMKSILNNNANSGIKTVNINSLTEISNINNSNDFNFSSNINKNNNINKSNIQKDYTIETNYPNQIITTGQEYNVHNIGNILSGVNEVPNQKNITKTEITKTFTTTTANNLNGKDKFLDNANMNYINTINSNLNNNINKNITSNYSQEITQFTTTNQQNIHPGSQRRTSNIFGGTLVQVLSNEINKNNQQLEEKNKNKNLINETHTEHIYGTRNGEIIKKVTKTQTVEYSNQLGQIEINPDFLFMYPIFNSNKLLGAIEDESTGKIEIEFKRAFGDKNIQLNEFTEGGAFCNYEKNLYFTGGKEKQKGIGKIFLKVSFQNDSIIKLSKMPDMNYSHWNHSMISNENYIFVIGGYNSNKCECFNLKTLQWENMPNLNSDERQRPMLVIYKDYLYAFMGYTQFNILESIERINISKLGKSKWEKVSISNPDKINLKFYGAGIYKQGGELYFIGGKVGRGDTEFDYKNEIYTFNFDKMVFFSANISFAGQLNFIENEFHYCNNENIGNFTDLNDGCLATISLSSLFAKI